MAQTHLEKFFDRVNHDIQGVTKATTEGPPQGGPLSPLLANILLDDLDKELRRRGHRFVRYADDCNIFVGSKRAGLRVKIWELSFEYWQEKEKSMVIFSNHTYMEAPSKPS
jgi:retron-type reverse transcriptase